jgi:hypothetical protein
MKIGEPILHLLVAYICFQYNITRHASRWRGLELEIQLTGNGATPAIISKDVSGFDLIYIFDNQIFNNAIDETIFALDID